MLVIDRVVYSDFPRREVAAIGWSAFDDLTPAYDLWTDCAGWRTPCLSGLARPDVARAHRTDALAASGFLVRFSVERRTDRARLIARRSGTETLLGDIPLQSWRPGPEPDPLGAKTDYTWWLRECERTLYWPPAEMRRGLKSLSQRPTISIILPHSGEHLYHLHRCVQSVVDQGYPQWELCVGADGSRDRRLDEYLTLRARDDARIKLSTGAAGDFVMRLDPQDELHPFALLEVARCVNAQPQVDVIYSDEDRIDQMGIRTSPAFKPEFDPYLYRTSNDLGRLVAIRADRVQLDPDRIAHIAKPLYHRRLPAPVNLSSAANGEATVPRAQSNVPGVRICVIYLASEGTYQRRALERTRMPPNASLVESEDSNGALPDSDVTIVVNCAIDSINHHCVEELAAQACRENVGLVGGVVVGTDQRIVTAGLACLSTGVFVNPFAGLSVEDPGYLSQARAVHRVAAIAPYLFAFRTARLRGLPGTFVLRPDAFAPLCEVLVRSAHAAGLDVLHTPFAVATLRKPAPPFEPSPDPSVPAHCRINPNLEAFVDIPAVMRAGMPSREPLITEAPVSAAADSIDPGPLRLRTPQPGLAAPIRRLLRAFG